MREKFEELFKDWSGVEPETFNLLPESGSNRKYYRIGGNGKTAIGVYNSNAEENNTFVHFSRHFKSKALNVPEIYKFDGHFYLQEDLGTKNLFDIVGSRNDMTVFTDEMSNLYKKVIDDLLKFQFLGYKDLDFSFCFQNQVFDKSQIIRDLNYFKYYFLKLIKVDFNEDVLDKEFEKLAEHLNQVDKDYFMYRDFQSRNIHVSENDELSYIDYQGGSKGPLQYDLVSLLFQAKAQIPEEKREELLNYYLEKLNEYTEKDQVKFVANYYLFALIRTLQVLGAYGFRGFVENKAHFITSIPFAIENLKTIIEKLNGQDYGHIKLISEQIYKRKSEFEVETEVGKGLIVRINSFSFRKSIPKDYSGNGGGFIFDCRALPNPGRYPEYQSSTGMDANVIEFLQKENEVSEFLDRVKAITSQSVDKYVSRGFQNLQINFGCTGGQHRSVYCAEQIASFLLKQFKVSVVLTHVEQGVQKNF